VLLLQLDIAVSAEMSEINSTVEFTSDFLHDNVGYGTYNSSTLNHATTDKVKVKSPINPSTRTRP